MKTYLKPCLFSACAAAIITLGACSEASSADEAKPAIAMDVGQANWAIQDEGSHIRFSAEQEGKTFTGEFEDFSGSIYFDPEALGESAVMISIDLNSVDAGSNDRNSTLPEKVWFSTKAYPAAVYTSSDISAQGAGYIAKGELTLKGKSVPLDLPFSLNMDGDRAVMTSKINMDRTLWNVGAAPWDTDEWVSRKVVLDIQVTALKTE